MALYPVKGVILMCWWIRSRRRED